MALSPIAIGMSGSQALTNINACFTQVDTNTTKLAGIEPGADVTDATNVAAAGAVMSGGALGTPSSGALTNCSFPTLNQNTTGYASGLKSATTTVGVSAATAPSLGQVLTATSGTAATWQTPAAASISTPNVCYVTTSGNDANSGAITAPFLTVQAAITAGFRVINIGAGTFTGAITISALDDVTLIGCGSGKTYLDCSSYLQFSGAGTTNTLYLHHLKISGIAAIADGTAMKIRGVDLVIGLGSGTYSIFGNRPSAGGANYAVTLDGDINCLGTLENSGPQNGSGQWNGGTVTLINGARVQGDVISKGAYDSGNSTADNGGSIIIGQGCYVVGTVDAKGGADPGVVSGNGGTVTLLPGSRVGYVEVSRGDPIGGGDGTVTAHLAEVVNTITPDFATNPGVWNAVLGCVIANEFWATPLAAVNTFGPSAVASLTVAKGIVTAAS